MTHTRRQFSAETLFASTLLGCVTVFAVAAGHASAQDYVFTNPAADSYVLTRAHVSLSTNATIDDIDFLNRKFGGDFLWVRRAGKQFIIRDHDVIVEAQRLFLPLDTLESEGEKIQEKQKQFESDQTTLDEEQTLLERKLESDHPDRDASNRRLSELKSKMLELESRVSELDSSQGTLESQRKTIEKTIETALWNIVDLALASGKGEDPNRE